MADWYGSARSNYFRVKDEPAFLAALEELDQGVEAGRNDKGQLTLLAANTDNGGWPSSRYNEQTDDFDDFDIAEFVVPYLADGEVAIFLEVGAEKLRYVTGSATAVDNKGGRVRLRLGDIYEAAATALGVVPTSITEALY